MLRKLFTKYKLFIVSPKYYDSFTLDSEIKSF